MARLGTGPMLGRRRRADTGAGSPFALSKPAVARALPATGLSLPGRPRPGVRTETAGSDLGRGARATDAARRATLAADASAPARPPLDDPAPFARRPSVAVDRALSVSRSSP